MQQALTIYVYNLKNRRLAESYCHDTYSTDTENAREVYLSLLKVGTWLSSWIVDRGIEFIYWPLTDSCKVTLSMHQSHSKGFH